MVSNEMSRVVGVIEWGSARDDWDPTIILAVGSDERVAEREVRREAARVTWAAVENDPTDWDLSLEDLPVLDLDSAASRRSLVEGLARADDRGVADGRGPLLRGTPRSLPMTSPQPPSTRRSTHVMSTPPPPALAPTCSMRERIEEVLAEADRVETAWIEAQGALGDPSPKEWQEHDDARSALAQTAVEVLRDLLAAVDGRQDLVLGQQTPALELFADGRRLDAVNLAPTHGPISTRCPTADPAMPGSTRSTAQSVTTRPRSSLVLLAAVDTASSRAGG